MASSQLLPMTHALLLSESLACSLSEPTASLLSSLLPTPSEALLAPDGLRSITLVARDAGGCLPAPLVWANLWESAAF